MSKAIEITPANNIGFIALARTLFRRYPEPVDPGRQFHDHPVVPLQRDFFTYALVLSKIYNVPSKDTPYYFIFFALGNLIGPLTIGRPLRHDRPTPDDLGDLHPVRRPLAISALLFDAGALDAVTPDRVLVRIFFFASAGASAAYLTVSEIFPSRCGPRPSPCSSPSPSFGALGPWLYGMLIGTGQDHFKLFIGYLIGAGVMIGGGLVEAFLGVAAEGRSLEDIASPLSSASTPSPHLANVTGAPDRLPPARPAVLTRRPTLC